MTTVIGCVWFVLLCFVQRVCDDSLCALCVLCIGFVVTHCPLCVAPRVCGGSLCALCVMCRGFDDDSLCVLCVLRSRLMMTHCVHSVCCAAGKTKEKGKRSGSYGESQEGGERLRPRT